MRRMGFKFLKAEIPHKNRMVLIPPDGIFYTALLIHRYRGPPSPLGKAFMQNTAPPNRVVRCFYVCI